MSTTAITLLALIRDCNAIMTFQLNLERLPHAENGYHGEWGAVISSKCHITRCTGPASARKQQR